MSENLKILASFLKMAFSYPKSFIKQINRQNFEILKKALVKESPSKIIKNVRKLLQNTNSNTINDAKKNVEQFFNSINKSDLNNKEVILFASHEASRSGAPLIILEVARYFKEKHNIFPIQLICDGGELMKEFEAVGPAYLLKYYFNAALLKEEMIHLMNLLNEHATVKKAYINSEGAGNLLPFIKRSGVETVISLIHEMGHYYDKNAWTHINKYADKVVFPANLVKQKAIENTRFDESKLHVLGQGLLKTELLKADKEKLRKQLRTELKVEPNAILILSCGILIQRKGIDIFILSAISFLNQYKGEQPVYFVWLGEETENYILDWNLSDIDASGYNNQIKLIGNRKNTIPYFMGSDVFYMCSRGDPYPCVVHEAVAAKLPLLVFKNATGFDNKILQQFGNIVDYGDVKQVVEILNSFVSEQQELKYYQNEEIWNNFLDNEIYCKKLFNL